MNTVELSLARDFLRRGWGAITVTLLTMIALPLWLFEALHYDGKLDPLQREAIALHVTLTLVMGFGAAVAVFQALGKLDRFFVRPISATRLAACQMGFALATIAAMYGVSTIVLNLRGIGWPLLGPMMFLAATLACALAAIWSLEGSLIAQLIGCTATSVPLTLWFSRCYGARIMGDWSTMWRQPTAAESLTLAGITAAAFVIAVQGVARMRRGETWSFAALKARWAQLTERTAAAEAFRGAFAAEVWAESRERNVFAPACVVSALMLLATLAWAGGGLNTSAFQDFITGLPIVGMIVVLPTVFGMVLGNFGNGSGKRAMRHFTATRPYTDTFLASAMLRTITRCVASTWLVWLVGWICLSYLSLPRESWESLVISLRTLSTTARETIVFALAFPVASWTLTALVACLFATGRPWLWFAVLAVICGLGVVLGLLKQITPPEVFPALITGFYLLSGAAYLGGTAAAYIAAVRLKLLSLRGALTAGGVLYVMYLIVIAELPRANQVPLVILWHGAGLLALILLPFAAGPLAIHWNRHR